MMMAQPFPAHQGIPQHPGLPPGHPMAPGQHPNAHPGAGMVQQVHPGVSAPGGPQVSQGGPVMGGMPPGAGTTGPGGAVQAHALSHLGPAQAHMFQQPHFAQQFANNPQLLQQHQQQQYLRQRMMLQHQHQQQQQQQHGGLPVQLPNGTPALNAAQIAAMQANPAMRPVNLQMQLQQMPHGQPQNLQQQQQFFAMQQAQQQAHQAQVQQAAAAGQPGQQTPQQRAAAQPQNVHDAQSVTPQPQPGPPPHQGSATPQPNPPPVPTSQPPQQQPAAPQPQPTPNPPPQQLPQAQQPGQQPQAPQAAQAQPQPQPNQQGPQQGQQQQPMTAQEAQIKAQQQQNPAAMMMQQQQQRMNMKGAAILQLNSFAESLSYISGTENASTDFNQWHGFVLRFYSPGGVLRHTVCNPQANSSKQFEIATPALARYYLTQCTSGIKHIQMLVDGARERDSPNGGHIVESAKTAFIYWFANGSQLFARANMTAHFDMNNKIEMLDIAVLDHNEYLPRSQLQALELSDQQKQSPKVSKNMGKRAQAKQAQQPAFTLPESMVTPNGVPTAVAETISHMQVLFQFSQQNPHLTPSEALRTLVNTMQAPAPNAAYVQGPMNPALQQGQPRAPSMSMPNQFASPAMTHLGLPGAQGSPHLTGSAHPSPAQSHLAGPPGMVPQGQVQGNMAQGTSASASPNVGNKRRRASTVKMENDETGGGPEVNGTAGQAAPKVKASPRVGAKKQKGGG